MSRLIGRLPIFRPITRLGLGGVRPLLPFSAGRLYPLRNPLASRQRAISSQNMSQSFSTSPPPSPSSSSSSETPLPEDATLTQKLKFLIKRYGWYALGVYIFFSTLDFSITFLAINYLGSAYVTRITNSIKTALPAIFATPDPEAPEQETSHSGREDLYAMLFLAYTIHKTLLLPFRVGMTAFFTPRFVGWLGKRGWVGTSGARRAAQEMRTKMRRGSKDINSS